MMPHCMPTNSFSARWQMWASFSRGIVSPETLQNARAQATSIAADELSPEPIGTFPWMTARRPATGYFSACRAAATPAGYLAQPCAWPRATPPRSNAARSSKSALTISTRASPEGRKAIRTSRSTAAGST